MIDIQLLFYFQRWNAPFITLEEEFNIITHPVSSNNPEGNSVVLMDEGNLMSLALFYQK